MIIPTPIIYILLSLLQFGVAFPPVLHLFMALNLSGPSCIPPESPGCCWWNGRWLGMENSCRPQHFWCSKVRLWNKCWYVWQRNKKREGIPWIFHIAQPFRVSSPTRRSNVEATHFTDVQIDFPRKFKYPSASNGFQAADNKWLVVSAHLKTTSQLGSSFGLGCKTKNIPFRNHHPNRNHRSEFSEFEWFLSPFLLVRNHSNG